MEQCCSAGVPAHGSDFLSGAYPCSFFYQHFLVVGIGAEKFVGVLNDYHFPIGFKPLTCIDHDPGARGLDWLARFATDIQPAVFTQPRRKGLNDFAAGGPAPNDRAECSG